MWQPRWTVLGLVPNDPVVGPGTMGALDEDFAHELIDAKAAAFAGTRFDLGPRTGTRDDTIDEFATCAFRDGAVMEVGHARAYAVSAVVLDAWTTAGGLAGVFGPPTSDPFEIDATRAAQEFANV